jgi:hypothetical protein
MTVAAIHLAEMRGWAQRSSRAGMRGAPPCLRLRPSVPVGRGRRRYIWCAGFNVPSILRAMLSWL